MQGVSTSERGGRRRRQPALWKECFPCLVQHARKQLEGIPRAVDDEEDVALGAMKSFCKAL